MSDFVKAGVAECSICFEVVDSLKILQCKHSLCVRCARKMFDSKEGTIACAECRQTTRCHRDVDELATRYIGSIGCDLCLESKDVDDIWWCESCLYSMCSKCILKTHKSYSGHKVEEWNKMGAVRYSIAYLDEMREKMTSAIDNNKNRETLKGFMGTLESTLASKLVGDAHVRGLRDSLIYRYGTQIPFKSASPNVSSNTDYGKAQRLISKVARLSGVDIDHFQIQDINNPSEMRIDISSVDYNRIADYIMKSFKLVPVEPFLNDDGGGASATTSSHQNQISSCKEFALPDDCHAIKVDHVFFSLEINGAIISSPKNLWICNLECSDPSEAFRMIPLNGTAKKDVRSVCLCGTSTASPLDVEHIMILVAMQSSDRSFDWSITGYQNKVKIDANDKWKEVFTLDMDIDSEDSIEDLKIQTSLNIPLEFYELRICQELGSSMACEIWRATLTMNTKTGNVKMKEKLLHQNGYCRYNQLLFYSKNSKSQNSSKAGSIKNQTIIVWDELNLCIVQLFLKEGKCEVASIIKHCIPYIVSPSLYHSPGNRILLYNSHSGDLAISKYDVFDKRPAAFENYYNVPSCSHLQTFLQQGDNKLWRLIISGNKKNLIWYSITMKR